MLHDTLWMSNLDLAQACLAHPFVRALGEGTLNADLFRTFIAQDAFFLRAFQKAYALALRAERRRRNYRRVLRAYRRHLGRDQTA